MHYLGICWRDKGKTEKLNTLAGVPVEPGGTWTKEYCITNGYLIRPTAQPIALSTDLYLDHFHCTAAHKVQLFMDQLFGDPVAYPGDLELTD